MASRLARLLSARPLALLLTGLAARSLLARATRAEAPPPRPPEPYWFPAPVVGTAIRAGAALVSAVWVGDVALRSRSQARDFAIALTGGEPDRAPLLLRRYGCAGCHTIPGAPGADGKVAAPLSDMRARVYVAGILPNTPHNLVRWIVAPPAFSPRTATPVTGITEAEARDVAAFLYAR